MPRQAQFTAELRIMMEPATREALEKIARERGVAVSTLARMVLVEFLRAEGGEAATP